VRRVLILAVVAAAVVAVALVLARPDPAPELHFDATVPDDLRAVAVEAWDGFIAAHPARADCIGSINMSAAWELDDRAEYRPERPATPSLGPPLGVGALPREAGGEGASRALKGRFMLAQGNALGFEEGPEELREDGGRS
jgi:hypothetical protein